MSKKAKKQNVARVSVEVQAPEVEVTENVTTAPEAETATTEPVTETATTETPVVEAKAKKARYAPTSVLVDAAVITAVKANPKRVGSKAYDRYARFHKEGQTVAEYIAANKEANFSGMLARNDLRWDLEHGHIEISLPVANGEAPASEEAPAETEVKQES